MVIKLVPDQTKFNLTVFSALIGFEFSPILKHGYVTDNRDIDIHPELIPKSVPNVKN